MNDDAEAMTVLMTADTVGGVWTYALELASGLAERGVSVVLATMGAPLSAGQAAAAATVPGLQLHESEYALEWMAEPWRDVDDAGAWLLGLEAEVAPAVVHVNGFAHAAVPFAAPVVAVAHSCVCTWWRAVHGVEAPASWDEYRRRVAAGLAAADEVVAPTAAILGDILAAHRAGRGGRVIYNGVDPARHRPARKEPIVLAVGRLWDQAKNLAALEACAAAVPWPIYVAGPVERPGGAAVSPRAVRSLGRLTGDEVAGWMSRAAIYAAPVRYEPFGLAIVEAALAGCALVLGDVPTLRELWADAALYVAPDDDAALGRAINALIDDPRRRDRLADHARTRAGAMTATTMASAYHALYRELA